MGLLWSRAEWSKRRARRLRAVQSRRDGYRRAHLATEPEAQRKYEAAAKATAEQLEALSQRMLVRYPVPSDQEKPAETKEIEVQAQGAAEPSSAKPNTVRPG